MLRESYARRGAAGHEASRRATQITSTTIWTVLRTGQLIPPRFAPGLSTTHGGFTTGDPGVSPDRTFTGWLP